MRAVESAFLSFRDAADAEALAEVWDRCAPRLFELARRIATDPGDAEEAVQRTFLAAIEGAARFAGGRPLMPWLVAILRRQIAQVARERYRAMRRVERTGRAPLDPAEAAVRREFAEELTRAIDALPEHLRPVIRLRLWHGLAPRAIAETLERSPSTVRTQLARGLAHLRTLLPKCLAGALLLGREARSMAAAREIVLRAAWSFASPALCAVATVKSLVISIGALACVALATLPLFELGVDAAADGALPSSPSAAANLCLHEAQSREPIRGTDTQRVMAPSAGRQQEKPRASLALRVVDDRGRPIAGVRVVARELVDLFDVVDAFGVRDVSTTAKPSEQRSVRGKTDAHGRLELRLAPRHWLVRVNPSRASSRDYGETRFDLALGARDVSRDVKLARASSRLHVRVLDERGATVSGVPLALVRESEMMLQGDVHKFCTSDDKSRAARSCNSCHAAPAATGRATKDLRISRAVSSQGGTASFHGLRAGRYRIVLGRDIDAVTLFPGALEALAIEQDSGSSWRPARAKHMVELDGYRLATVDFGVARKGEVEVELAPRDSEVALLLRRVAADKAKALRLAKACGFDRKTAAFAPDTPASRRVHKRGCAAKDAEMRIPNLAPGAYTLSFRLPASSRFAVPADRRILVEPGRTTRLRVPFEAANASLAGQLLVGGKPAARYTVELVQGTRLLKRSSCDEGGKYAFAGLRPGRYRLRWIGILRTEGRSAFEAIDSIEVQAPSSGLVHMIDAPQQPRRAR